MPPVLSDVHNAKVGILSKIPKNFTGFSKCLSCVDHYSIMQNTGSTFLLQNIYILDNAKVEFLISLIFLVSQRG